MHRVDRASLGGFGVELVGACEDVDDEARRDRLDGELCGEAQEVAARRSSSWAMLRDSVLAMLASWPDGSSPA